MPNRLANERSPYLRQHQHNPVDWYPWGDEAFEKAAREDKPIFLSVGYSSCHWCHVMEHESFEDDAVASILNAFFVSVKVDREERPDIDEAYMTAVQMQSGRGGWPMSVFLRSDKKPFFAGTYFPKLDRQNVPGFLSVLQQIRALWMQRRETVDEAADAFAEQISVALSREAPATFNSVSAEAMESVVQAMANEFDATFGGFGGAPKFPPHTALEFLLEYAAEPAFAADSRALAREMAVVTLEKMSLGGIHDHIGGGFHRYSTDEMWLLPHFEKMLYDNAALLSLYVRAADQIEADQPQRAAGFRDVAKSIVKWLKREMTASDGTFFAALDADADGEEGTTYLWTMNEVIEALGDDGESFAFNYGFEIEGNYRDEATQRLTGSNIPHLRSRIDVAQPETLERLLTIRNKRAQPALDDKSLICWNGLMIAALVDAGETRLAEYAADAILHASNGGRKLPRYLSEGNAFGEAFLEDVAALAIGLGKLATTSLGARFKEPAALLCRALKQRFYDPSSGGFFATDSHHEKLFARVKPVFDQPVESANAMALRALMVCEDADAPEIVDQSLSTLFGWMERAPQATQALFTVGLRRLRQLGALAGDQIEEGRSITTRPTVMITPREFTAGPDGWAEGALTILLPPGVTIHGPVAPTKWLIPTTVEIAGLEGRTEFPDGDELGYEGDVRIAIYLKMSGTKDAEEAEIAVTYQACTERECLPPETIRLTALVKAPGARI